MIKIIQTSFAGIDPMTALMQRMGFQIEDTNFFFLPEEGEIVVLTFNNGDSQYSKDNFYIETPATSPLAKTYYSLFMTYGYTTNNFDKFLELHNNNKKKSNYTVKRMPQ